MKKITLTLAGVTAVLFLSSQAPKDQLTLQFEENSFYLSEEEKLKLDLAWSDVPKGGALEILLLSKQESKEDFRYKTGITARRAEAVSKYLLRKKISKKNILVKVTPLGKNKDKISLTGLANRKFVRCGGTYSLVARKPANEPVPWTGCSCPALSSKEPCVHIIDASEDSRIRCPWGTIIDIPARAFLRKDGNAVECGKITITVYEFYTIEEMLAAGLSTQSGKKMLETGGMLHISASCNGEELMVGGLNKISIYIPNNSCLPGMKVFEGKQEDRNLNWKESSSGTLACDRPRPAMTGDPDSLDPEDSDVTDYESYGECEGGCDWYLMSVSKLGWINCDRFIDVKKKTELIVSTDTSLKPTVVLVFENYKSIMPGYYFSPDGKIRFNDIPENEPVLLLAYSISKDKSRVMFGSRYLTLGESTDEYISLSSGTLDSFNALVSGLSR